MEFLNYYMDRLFIYKYLNIKDKNISIFQKMYNGLLVKSSAFDKVRFFIHFNYRGKNKRYICLSIYREELVNVDGSTKRAVTHIGHDIYVEKTRVIKPGSYLSNMHLDELIALYNDIIDTVVNDDYIVKVIDFY